MAQPVRTAALVAKLSKLEDGELLSILRELIAELHQHGCQLRVESSLAERLGETPADPQQLRECDLCVVVGGDGTLIRAVKLLGDAEVPIFAVNAGTLGFLTEIPREQARALLRQALQGDFQYEPRLKLRVRLRRGGKVVVEEDVLNDAVINRGAFARMVMLATSVDGATVTSYRADGLIVASPTGSTAYNLAASGPILYPMLGGIVINPICPHTLTQRPLVVPDRSQVAIEVIAAQGEILLSLDGQSSQTLQVGDRVEVERSPSRALLIRNPQLDFFEVLRNKLHWGER